MRTSMRQFRDTDYYVSEDGVVINRVTNRVVGRGECVGYKVVRTRKKGSWYVHQMVMECYGTPSPDNGYVIDHIDENKHNNHIDNLRWLTIGENVSRSNNLRMYTDEFEQQIRDEYVPRVVTRQMLCAKYNITLGTLKDILRRTR